MIHRALLNLIIFFFHLDQNGTLFFFFILHLVVKGTHELAHVAHRTLSGLDGICENILVTECHNKRCIHCLVRLFSETLSRWQRCDGGQRHDWLDRSRVSELDRRTDGCEHLLMREKSIISFQDEAVWNVLQIRYQILILLLVRFKNFFFSVHLIYHKWKKHRETPFHCATENSLH